MLFQLKIELILENILVHAASLFLTISFPKLTASFFDPHVMYKSL